MLDRKAADERWLLRWINDERDMPWGGAILDTAAEELGLPVVEVRRRAEALLGAEGGAR